jgi:hypothetical protein
MISKGCICYKYIFRVAKLGRWVAKSGIWVAKVVAHLHATAALWVRIQT